MKKNEEKSKDSDRVTDPVRFMIGEFTLRILL